jgi:hypothetical protein
MIFQNGDHCDSYLPPLLPQAEQILRPLPRQKEHLLSPFVPEPLHEVQ